MRESGMSLPRGCCKCKGRTLNSRTSGVWVCTNCPVKVVSQDSNCCKAGQGKGGGLNAMSSSAPLDFCKSNPPLIHGSGKQTRINAVNLTQMQEDQDLRTSVPILLNTPHLLD